MRHGLTLGYVGGTSPHGRRSRGAARHSQGSAIRSDSVGAALLLALVIVTEVIAVFVVYAVTNALLPGFEWWSMLL